MRYAFGLVSLLVGVALTMLFFSKFEIRQAKQGQEIKQQVLQPWTGKTADGTRAQDSIKMDGQSSGGQLNGLLVTSVTPGGYYDQYFGLKTGDKIVQVKDQDVANFSDEGMAEAMVWEAGTGTLTVLRNGQKLTLLPRDGTSGVKGPASPPASSSGTQSVPGLPGVQIPQAAQ